jgi:ATP-binding cassette, subfamily B, bacterial
MMDHLSEVKGSLLVASLCTLGVAAMDLLRPWPLKIIFDNVLLDKPLPPYISSWNEMFHTDKAFSIVIVSFAIIAITGIKSALSYSQLFITARLGHKLAHSLRRSVFNHLQGLSLSFFKKAESGDLLTKVTSDTNNLRDVFVELALNFVSEALSLIGMLTIMLFLNWKLSLVVLATFPILLTLSLYRYNTIKNSARRQRKAEGKIASRLSEILNSVLVVQAFGREDYEEERFESQSSLTLEEGVRTARLEAAAARATEIVGAIGTWAVILFGSLEALHGSITPGSVLVFVSYTNSLYGPIRNLAKLSTKLSKAAVSAQRIMEVLEVEPEIKEAPNPISASNINGEVVFDNVRFDYGDGRTVLQDIAFRISPGEHVALVGPSGSGKSTLCGLILRFYDPQQGSILVEGIDIREYQLQSLRSQIGIVLQDSLLFGATIKENIAYGKLDATMDEIVNAAKAANAHDFICELPHGYDTVVSERGSTLSGGQRQRIAIARTLIRNAPILILDEPMTGLDAESVSSVREALDRLMAGRTCLLITHDLKAATTADRIILLESGRIVATGSHDELVIQSQRYRQLCQVRSGPEPSQRVA